MKTGLHIADGLTLDLPKLVDSRMLVTANSGGGKSWLLRLIAEQAAGHVQTIILDPEGEFATLRERFDFLLIGSGGEIPCEVRSAGLLARKLLELQASAVIDLYDLKLPDRRRFVRLFLESLMHLPKPLWRPLIVMLDESHLFCPERASGEAESTSAVIDLMSQGRKRSYCGILATQRLSKLHKDAEAEANNVFVGRSWLDLDQQRAGNLLGMDKTARQELRDLFPGGFVAFGPALSTNGVTRFRTAPVVTTHPKAGERHKLTPPKPSDAVRRIVADLADLPQQAEAEVRDLADAKRKIGELQRELRQRPTAPVEVEKIVKVPVLENGQLDRTEKIAARIEGFGEKLKAEGERYLTEAAELKRLILPAVAKPVAGGLVSPAPARPRPARPIPPKKPVRTGGLETTRQTESSPLGGLTGPEQRVLDALAELGVLGVLAPDKIQVALLAGYTNLTSKGFSNSVGRLRTGGLISYPDQGRMAITDAGRAAANAPAVPQTSAEVQERFVALLGGVHAKILRPVIDAYPNEVSKEDLMVATGYGNATSKGFSNALGRLRSLGLIDYPGPGRVAATPILFVG